MQIMVCYNGSEASQETLDVAMKYAKAFSARVHVVTSLAQKIETDLSDLSQREKAQQRLLEVKERLGSAGLDCVVALVTDDLTDGENLLHYADEHGVDALAVGVSRVSKVGKLLFGSTAQHVILAARCPVISVKPKARGG
ncbi:MAG: universal stress protein [Deferrisomatales bacterium]|nr:universal stress protein [Deferrisomatales bacterium]